MRSWHVRKNHILNTNLKNAAWTFLDNLWHGDPHLCICSNLFPVSMHKIITNIELLWTSNNSSIRKEKGNSQHITTADMTVSWPSFAQQGQSYIVICKLKCVQNKNICKHNFWSFYVPYVALLLSNINLPTEHIQKDNHTLQTPNKVNISGKG